MNMPGPSKIDDLPAGRRRLRHQLTSTLTVDSPCPPYTFFSRLRRDNPSPFGAYLQYGSYQIISSSMERLLHIDGRHIETRPIKARGGEARQRRKMKSFAKSWRHPKKDRSELLMIVDLERNDLHKICQPGSVTVPTLFSVEDYASVFHLVASVTGILLPDQTAMDALTALFPGGSITGAPKRRAMEIIDELESSRRQLYTAPSAISPSTETATSTSSSARPSVRAIGTTSVSAAALRRSDRDSSTKKSGKRPRPCSRP